VAECGMLTSDEWKIVAILSHFPPTNASG